jgi:HD-GYP domain-containing protein (c-di-GMP phosphodiesterase class II)
MTVGNLSVRNVRARRLARARENGSLPKYSFRERETRKHREAIEATVAALAAALELRDDETGRHAQRVTEVALALARLVSPDLVANPELRFGFLLHDIGKIGIPDGILLKPASLSPDETRIMQTHTVLGEHLIHSVPHLQGLARDVIVYHHERWDGGGYPWGLAGLNIPLPARIFSVADAYDALTCDRPYRRAVSQDDALAEIQRVSGTQFDPAVVEALCFIAPTLSSHVPGRDVRRKVTIRPVRVPLPAAEEVV